jgi:hypothetical protein
MSGCNCILNSPELIRVITYPLSCLPPFCVKKNGMTALMNAARNGHTLTVKILLEGGADARQVDEVRKRKWAGRWK